MNRALALHLVLRSIKPRGIAIVQPTLRDELISEQSRCLLARASRLICLFVSVSRDVTVTYF